MNFEPSPSEQSRIPFSFWVFGINLGFILLALLLSFALASAGVSPKYSTAVTAPIFVGITLLSSGIYAGWTYRSTDHRRMRLNKIGLWGNAILYLFVLVIIIGFSTYRAM